MRINTLLIKNFFKNNILFIGAIAFLIITQAPTIANNFGTQGTDLSSFKIKTISPNGQSEKEIDFPPKGKAMAIFWSTTCGPCRVEMARLKSSVEDGKIPKDSLFALNSFESPDTVKKFLTENEYPFTFMEDPGLAAVLNVRATPTTIFLENGKVTSMKSGMSLTGIWSAEIFFDK